MLTNKENRPPSLPDLNLNFRLFVTTLSMTQLSTRVLQCAFIFLLFSLPNQAFTLFLVFYYCGKHFFLELVFPSEGVPLRPFSSFVASDLLRSSLFVLALPYVLLGIALLLQASSSTVAEVSNLIPYRNASAAILAECILLACSCISTLPYVPLEHLGKILTI